MFGMKKSAGGGARKLGVAAAALAITGAGLLAGAGPAAAGTNGQQLAVSSRWADQLYACGHNQDDRYVCSGWKQSPDFWTYFPGYWFKGDVTVYGLRNGYNEVLVAKCSVPKSQDGDWSYCLTNGEI
ncbi:hypothetical protein ACZ90_53425 [Streptomyces albus subsp. albus]|nr:hypothetical protein ACZ90_53425 [Streptomyces albus subsp. albus]